MKKTGFTLAEALITIAILGVLAMLTLPSLNNNINHKKVGPALAKVVNRLETVNKELLFQESARRLNEVQLTYESETSSYLNRIAKAMSGELDGNELDLRYLHFLRHEQRFSSLDDLREQIRKDFNRACNL